MALSLLLLSSGCAMGLGRTSAAWAPAFASRSTEAVVTKSHGEIGRGGSRVVVVDAVRSFAGRAFTGGGGLRAGAFASVVPSWSGGSAEALSLSGSGWTAEGNVLVGYGRFALTGGYLSRYQSWDFAGGFGMQSRMRGPLLYLGYAPVPFLGVDLGGGPLFGRLDLGGRGNVLNDPESSLARADAKGLHTALRATFFLTAGGDLLMQSAVRVEAGYDRLWADEAPGLPATAGTFSAGAALVLSFF